MSKTIRTLVLALAVVGIVGSVTVAVPEALAAPVDEIRGGVNAAGGSGQNDLNVKLQDIVNIMLYVLGAIAVIMIVIGGIKYTTSNGDSSSVKSAKDTILYSVVGLVVAIMAYAIVNFVLGSF